MKINNVVKSFRIDEETAELMHFLKENNVRFWNDIRISIKKILLKKAKEFKFKEKEIIYPF